MECPYCRSDSRVLDSRRSGFDVRRRRECLECKRRFTTYERLEPPEIRVVKRRGPPQVFDRDKLVRAVLRVSRGRPVTRKACEDLVRGLEAELVGQGVESVTSAEIAERLLGRLEELDPLAARRFSSNYRGEDGVLRFPWPEGEGPPQLALPLPGQSDVAPVPAPRPRRKSR